MTAAAVATPRPEVLLIDLSSLFWSAWHATEKDISSDAVAITMAAVKRCWTDHSDLMGLNAICLDQGRSFRKALAPEYKAQRPEKDHAALNQLADVKRKLVDAGYLLWGADGFEADDVIATAATIASAKGHPVRICTSDKDLLQLLSLPCSSVVRTYNTWDTWRATAVVEKFGVDPDGLGDYLALVGDKSDNIDGAKGVGPVTAKALLIAHYNLDRIYDRIDALAVPGNGKAIIQTKTPEAAKVATPAVIQSLWDNREKVLLARKLVTLRTDAPIKFDEIYEKREPKAVQEVADMDDAKFDDDRISVAQEKVIGLAEAAVKSAEGDGVARDVVQEIRAGLKEESRPKDAVSTSAAQEVAIAVTPASVTSNVAVSYQQALEPMSLGQTFKLAGELYKAGLYAKFGTPQAIAAVIMRGRELGIGALTSLDAFHVVEGRPFPWAYLLISLAKADRDCEYFSLISSSDVEATWETKSRRREKPQRYTYTIQEATVAGLLVIKPGKQPGPWLTRPRDQLTKTAGAKLQRVEYPGSGLGLFCVEEMGGE